MVYRESSVSSLTMAKETARRTVTRAEVSPDLIICATETAEPGQGLAANAELARELGAPAAVTLTVSGHGCGNLGALLQVAQGMLRTTAADSILLVTTDRARSAPRMLGGALSALSDGAAAVLATRRAPGVGKSTFAVRGVSMRCDARGDTADVSPAAQRRTLLLGRSAAGGLREVTGRAPTEYQHVLFSNYRLSSQRFLAGAAGFAARQLRPGPVSEYGHCFAADLLVNCDLLSSAGVLAPGDRLALSATGPNSWTLIDLEVTAQTAEARA